MANVFNPAENTDRHCPEGRFPCRAYLPCPGSEWTKALLPATRASRERHLQRPRGPKPKGTASLYELELILWFGKSHYCLIRVHISWFPLAMYCRLYRVCSKWRGFGCFCSCIFVSSAVRSQIYLASWASHGMYMALSGGAT